MVFVFLLKTLYFRIVYFFRNWYLGGFYWFKGKGQRLIRNLENNLSIKINLRYMFQPLYQEYNIYGYVLGFIFRFIRVVLGSVLYLLIILFFGILYIIWALIPIFFVYKAVFPQSKINF